MFGLLKGRITSLFFNLKLLNFLYHCGFFIPLRFNVRCKRINLEWANLYFLFQRFSLFLFTFYEKMHTTYHTPNVILFDSNFSYSLFYPCVDFQLMCRVSSCIFNYFYFCLPYLENRLRVQYYTAWIFNHSKFKNTTLNSGQCKICKDHLKWWLRSYIFGHYLI